ncbi:MAG TPA: CocE/NonD family hydrolase [Planctomycetes bacterium]|nr:CocE/NonD family hydrolase [Planctomycetota bacterium]
MAKTSHMVPMRDGVRLATDVYRPAGEEKPLPVILMRTPYSKEGGQALAQVVCRRGYALVAQDMRGRFQSEGSDAVVFHNDAWATPHRDGHDTLRWIIAQPWCNGRIGTMGGSALGIVQNLMAPDAPDQLIAQYVSVAFSNMYTQAVYQGGVFRKSLLENWLRSNRFDPKNLETFRSHYKYDAFWKQLNPEEHAEGVNVAAVFHGGWYDIFLQGTINSFVALQRRGGPRARGNCRLVIGPWAHGNFKGLTYPPNARETPVAVDRFRFFRYWLKGVDNGVPKDKAVHYYVMGDPEQPDAPGNVWRAADRWPPPFEPLRGYFHANGKLEMTAPTAPDADLTYRYDPLDPVPTLGGQNLNIPKGPMDQRPVESRPDVLVFTSPVLKEPVEVTGPIRARLYVSSDCPDTDFTVKLCDVYPDGRSMLLTDGILRARFREGFDREVFLEPNRVYELEVDLWSTSLVFNRGHRIRVSVSSSNAPRFEPNPNNGQPHMGMGNPRVANNRLYVSARYPSHIVLPRYTGPKGW